MKSVEIQLAFKTYFGHSPQYFVQAPGRINMIGEHTDYNQGFVLPAAINKNIYFAVSKRSDSQLHLYSVDLEDHLEVCFESILPSEKGWANFLLGVVSEMQKQGKNFDFGLNIAFGGNVPLGAGLSSSAAIESGMGTLLNALFNLDYSLLDLALIAQGAEQRFAGLNCGIMDMYASLFGQRNRLIKLDCKSLSHEYLEVDLKGKSILLFNSGVKHSLADSAYNKRRAECEEGVSILKAHYPEVASLRDVELMQLEKHKAEFPPVVYQRCLYVVSEAERMKKATKALQNNDLESFGQLMFETHDGLSQQYAVSCDELDTLVELVRGKEGVFGARMMGGGFGGCTLNLLDERVVENTIAETTKAYKNKYGFEPEHFVVEISDGCKIEELK
ncbi:galactokinase [Marinilongibacter aquaticus]|uniref:galactokinase n=1 Tax=Marinilongibacter aquaticus TaxID=2975157 RepID=UPI0021BDD7AE|nr:galactokinase [Marinilongibacter aquaticus]UBM60118.1 galactokinase [Marinilongibacter aquaticus]